VRSNLAKNRLNRNCKTLPHRREEKKKRFIFQGDWVGVDVRQSSDSSLDSRAPVRYLDTNSLIKNIGVSIEVLVKVMA
jgi:hypothetical protein